MKRTYGFRVKLKDALFERGMTQKELAEVTGLRESTISEIASNSRSTINKAHLSKIMDALDMNELDQILELRIEEEY